MDAFGLPMSFGKKAKAKIDPLAQKLKTTQRSEPEARASPPAPSPARPATQSSAGPSGPVRPPTTARDEEDDDIGPIPPAATNGTANGASKRKASSSPEPGHTLPRAGDGQAGDEDDDDSDFGEEEEVDRTPISHEIVLKDHNKVVSALCVDPSGSRIASGSHDYDTKLWDFGGMDNRLKPFKSFEANGNYHVHDVDYSPDGQHLLVISGTIVPKVFSRDGDEEAEYNKGDVYLRDMRNTKGHVAEINSGSWHPQDNKQFLTCSNDSTLRIWNTDDKWKQKQVIVVKSKERGARTKVTSCAWSHDGRLVAGACTDGTLHVWSTNSNFARPDKSNETAHVKDTETSGVAFARDGFRIATRGGDDTVKLFDIRSIRKPLAEAKGLDNIYPETNLIFSPDDRSILTGVAARKGEQGSLVFLNGDSLAQERHLPIGQGSVVRVFWHSRVNQIFCGLSSGAIHCLYSPHSSIHGALLPLSKMPKSTRRNEGYTSADLQPVIYTPEVDPGQAAPGWRESLHQKEKRAKKMRPQEPVSGVGKGGRLGASETQGFVQTLFPDKIDPREDPREALLRYAEKKDDAEK